LVVNTITKTLSATSSKSLLDRLYTFESSLQVDSGSSFLDPIFHLNRRVENFCILCVQAVLEMCLSSKPIRTYIFGLNGPTLVWAKYLDFYEEFIIRYIDESKRSYYSTVTSFDKTALGN
jgi:hypothetical protein